MMALLTRFLAMTLCCSVFLSNCSASSEASTNVTSLVYRKSADQKLEVLYVTPTIAIFANKDADQWAINRSTYLGIPDLARHTGDHVEQYIAPRVNRLAFLPSARLLVVEHLVAELRVNDFVSRLMVVDLKSEIITDHTNYFSVAEAMSMSQEELTNLFEDAKGALLPVALRWASSKSVDLRQAGVGHSGQRK